MGRTSVLALQCVIVLYCPLAFPHVNPLGGGHLLCGQKFGIQRSRILLQYDRYPVV
jgi:hypothetical protein